MTRGHDELLTVMMRGVCALRPPAYRGVAFDDGSSAY
jgi:hypothetical protein